MNGIGGTRILHERFPDLPIIVFTVHEEDDRICQAVSAGARLFAEEHAAEPYHRSPQRGRRRRRSDVALSVIKPFRTFSPPEKSDHRLTEQKTRILKLLVDGHHYQTAAFELGISTATVAFHLKNVNEKLQVHSKTEAVANPARTFGLIFVETYSLR